MRRHIRARLWRRLAPRELEEWEESWEEEQDREWLARLKRRDRRAYLRAISASSPSIRAQRARDSSA